MISVTPTTRSISGSTQSGSTDAARMASRAHYRDDMCRAQRVHGAGASEAAIGSGRSGDSGRSADGSGALPIEMRRRARVRREDRRHDGRPARRRRLAHLDRRRVLMFVRSPGRASETAAGVDQ